MVLMTAFAQVERAVDAMREGALDYLVKVANAEEALAALRSEHFALVISDVNMPGMDGHGLLRTLRERHPGVPMVLMTAFAQVERAVDAMREGALDYLVKPFEPSSCSICWRATSIRRVGRHRTRALSPASLPVGSCWLWPPAWHAAIPPC